MSGNLKRKKKKVNLHNKNHHDNKKSICSFLEILEIFFLIVNKSSSMVSPPHVITFAELIFSNMSYSGQCNLFSSLKPTVQSMTF